MGKEKPYHKTKGKAYSPILNNKNGVDTMPLTEEIKTFLERKHTQVLKFQDNCHWKNR